MSDDDQLRRARARLGTTLNGKYRLDDLLGMGGMAAVYRATHRNRAQLAVKMLHPELSMNPDVRDRFLREAYAANSVQHPGAVVVVDDATTEDGVAFLVMELLDGLTVEQLSERYADRVPLPLAVEIVYQLLDVLAAAHAANIVHRDIKPANLFITRDGNVKVLDFGIARVLESSSEDAKVTGAGMPVGTPAFMAPEQALARSADIGPGTDIWAAGATLFTLLSGEMVHESATAAETLARAATRAARSLAEVVPDAPRSIVTVVDRALAFDRPLRWESARQMADALGSAFEEASGSPPSKATLAGLFPARASSMQPPASREVADLASAPTLDAASVPVGPGSSSTLGRPVAGAAARGRLRPPRRGRAGLLVAALVLAVAVPVAIRERGRIFAPHGAQQGTGPVVGLPEARQVDGPPEVLIRGIENRTTDPVLDETLDLVLESALTRSPRLYPFAGPNARALVAEEAPEAAGDDEKLGRTLAARRGRQLTIVRGAVAPDGAGYLLSLEAFDGASHARQLATTQRAENTETIIPAVARLACELRGALRDAPCDEASWKETGMSLRVDADHEFSLGRGGFHSGKFAEGFAAFQRAVAADRDFTAAHHQLGLMLWNASRMSEAQAELRLALAGQDRLSERQRLSMAAASYLLNDELDEAARTYEALIAQWPADVRVLGNLSEVYVRLGETAKALDSARRAALQSRKNPTRLANLVSMQLAAGQLEEAASEGRRIVAEFPHPPGYAYTALAAASALLGHRDDAVDVYQRFETLERSTAVMSKADFAMYEGRLSDAIAILSAVGDDSKGVAEAVSSWAMLGEALLRKGDRSGARAAALHAKDSPELITMARVARVFAGAGHVAEAVATQRRIAEKPGQRAPMFAHLVAIDVLRAQHARREAFAALGSIGKGTGAWLAHADLGAAYFELGDLELAASELEECTAHLGAGASVWDDTVKTLRYVPPVLYMLGRAKEALHRPDARATYDAFLATQHDAQDDPLVKDAQRRVSAM